MNEQPVPFEYEGVTYTLHPFNDLIRAKLERECEATALRELEKRKSILPDYAEQRRLVVRDIINGQYKIGTPQYAAFDTSDHGQIVTLLHVLQDERVDEVLAREMLVKEPQKIIDAYTLANPAPPKTGDEDPKA